MAVKKKSSAKKAAPKKAAVKAAPKKAVVKKVAPKKAAPKTAAPKKAAGNNKPIAEKQTKTQIITSIAEETGIARKDVAAIFASLGGLVQRHMAKRGSGEFSVPDTGVKIRRVVKPATKSRKMISPFTGQEITVKAKPARNIVKITALKSLKDSVTK